MITVDVLIIGAGPGSLTLANYLAKKNTSYLIVEKSRGVGGRVATRRINDIKFDHGAPFLEQHKELLELIDQIGHSKIQTSNSGLFTEDGMTSLFKKMSESLNIKKETKIIRLEKNTFNWTAISDADEKFNAKILVNTAPLPQALQLLKDSHLGYWHEGELESINYSKAVIGLFYTNEDVSIRRILPSEVHSVFSMKERTKNPSAFILRASPLLSNDIFEASEEIQMQKISQLFQESVLNLREISFSEIKKWRYVIPEKVLPYPYLEVLKDLYLVGDAFQYPNVQGAISGATTLAKKLTSY